MDQHRIGITHVTMRASWPAYLGEDPDERELRLLPAAPGRRPDLLAILGQASDQGLGNSGQRLMLLRQGPLGPLPETPQQVLSFEAARLTPSLADLDGDGRTDLVVRQFRLPDFSDVLTGLEFELSFFWYRGDGRGFERQPTLRDDRTYDEEQMDELIESLVRDLPKLFDSEEYRKHRGVMIEAASKKQKAMSGLVG